LQAPNARDGSETSAHSAAQREFSTSKEQPARKAGSLWSVATNDVAETGHGVDKQTHPGDSKRAGKYDIVDGPAGKITVVGSGSADPGDMNERKCHVEAHAEYAATEVIRWGASHVKVCSVSVLRILQASFLSLKIESRNRY
jgi:hypothetical protein